MKTPVLILAAAPAVASPALAAEDYAIDASHADVSFQVRHLVSQVTGRFNAFEGSIRVDRDNPQASSVQFTIQSESIDTSNEKRDEHLRSADFFDVASHPTITFRSTSMKALGEGRYEVTGDFTMHGVTKTITLPVEVLGEMKDPWGKQRIGFQISTTINRKDYGISYNKVLDQGGLMLGEDVKVSVNLEAVRQEAQAD